MSITGHEKLKKLDKLKIVNLKKENRDRKKVLNKVKVVEHCDSTISEIPILTVALFWSSNYDWQQSK